MSPKEALTLSISCLVIVSCLLTFAMVKNTLLTYQVFGLNSHIDYLEEYIGDNGLPTPAPRIDL